MALHPAENRGYRELYLTGRGTVKRLERLVAALPEAAGGDSLEGAAEAVGSMLAELAPLTARHQLYGSLAAEGSGAGIGGVRGAVVDRFLERNQALRLAVDDLTHLANLLAYLCRLGEVRGDEELPQFCASWERRLRRRAGAVRKSSLELAANPDLAVEPLDGSPLGRTAHRAAWAVGTAGEWIDRQVAGRGRRR